MIFFNEQTVLQTIKKLDQRVYIFSDSHLPQKPIWGYPQNFAQAVS